MEIFYAVIALLLGGMSFVMANPAGMPVFALAFAAAGFLRERRGARRKWLLALLAVAIIIGVIGSIISLQINFR